MSPRPFFRRALLCLALMGASLAASAERQALTWQVVDGDVNAARAQLVQQLFKNIGLQGDLFVSSATANIDGQLTDIALVTSTTRLTRFTVVEEELTGNTLRMVVEFDRSTEASAPCTPPLFARNIEVRASLQDKGINIEWREALQDYLAALHQALSRQHPMVIAPRQSTAQAAFLLQLRIHPLGDGSRSRLSIVLEGVDGSSALEIRREFNNDELRVRKRVSLGYADLITWNLSNKATQQIDEVSAALYQPLRCLPVVLKVRADEKGDFLIDGTQNPEAPPPATALYSPVFPLDRGFGVNFLKLSRLLSVTPLNAGKFQLLDVKKTASPSERKADGFAIILH